MSMSINGTNGLTFNDGTTQATGAFYGGLGFRNRIINGAMMIDQRNAGASVTAGSTYPVDRFSSYRSGGTGAYTAQQSSTAPAGFRNSIIATVTSTGTSNEASIYQAVEGFNVADFNLGTSSAVTFTLSFWVRSSVTGTYSLSFRASGGNRSYVTTYVINSANTWEQKTITVAGDTTGTWNTTNGAGLIIDWSLGQGTLTTSTLNSWQGSNLVFASGATNLLATNGATFYITGVQLEKGSTATSFDYRPYGTELALCQRYFYTLGGLSYSYTTSSTEIPAGANGTSRIRGQFSFPVTMRTSPSATLTGTPTFYGYGTANPTYSSTSAMYGSNQTYILDFNTSSVTNGSWNSMKFDSSAYVSFSAEL